MARRKATSGPTKRTHSDRLPARVWLSAIKDFLGPQNKKVFQGDRFPLHRPAARVLIRKGLAEECEPPEGIDPKTGRNTGAEVSPRRGTATPGSLQRHRNVVARRGEAKSISAKLAHKVRESREAEQEVKERESGPDEDLPDSVPEDFAGWKALGFGKARKLYRREYGENPGGWKTIEGKVNGTEAPG